MNPFIQDKTILLSLLIASVVACSGVFPTAQAVVPPPDGGYPGGNTAEGNAALRDLTTGEFNTAIGLFSLTLNTGGDSNTAVGASALRNNTTGNQNTAVGADSLRFNMTGITNTANGYQALFSNTIGSFNNAFGSQALYNNTTGSSNNALGDTALEGNTSGNNNTAIGDIALRSNNTGEWNTATGAQALNNNTTGNFNTANGFQALSHNTTGGFNTAAGPGALFGNSTGSNNIALGAAAGDRLTTGDYNIDIGNGGASGESGTIRIGDSNQNATYIAGIFGVGLSGSPVVVNGNGRLGVSTSSARYKQNIKSMDKTSEAILALRPVTFRYKKEIDATASLQFGLVAEEVEKVNPALVVRDEGGKPHTVRYDAVNAMLLNEFLKEHRAFLEEQCKVERLEKQIDALTAAVKKVSAQLATANGAAGMRSDIDGSSRQADMSGSELVNPSSGGLDVSKPCTASGGEQLVNSSRAGKALGNHR